MSSSLFKRFANKILFDQWICLEELGSGTFGTVVLCQNLATLKIAACKIELQKKGLTSKNEIKLLDHIQTINQQMLRNTPRQKPKQNHEVDLEYYPSVINGKLPNESLKCPKLYAVYEHGEYLFVIMEKMGKTLTTLFNDYNKDMPYVMIACIAIQ